MTPASTRVRGLDGLRAIAAFAIILHHVGFWSGATFDGMWGRYLGRLDIGVPVFFALSGFLLFRPIVVSVLDDRPLRPVLVHLWRRALRIYPAFWVAILLIVVLTSEEFRDAGGAIVTALLVHIHWPTHTIGPMPQAWSLATEVSFYAALPLMARFLRPVLSPLDRDRRRNLLYGFTALGALGSVAFRIIVLGLDNRWTGSAVLWLPGTFDYFAVGMALAVAREGHREGTREAAALERMAGPAGLWWLTAAALFHVVSQNMGLALGLETASWPREMGRQLVYALIGFCLLYPLVFGDQRRSLVRRVTRSRPMEWLGLISYSIYLWHMVFIVHPWSPLERLVDRIVDQRFLLVLTVAVIPTLVVATISYYLVERPAMGLQGRLRRSSVERTPLESRVAAGLDRVRRVSFRAQLTLIATAGLVLRVGYVLASKRNHTLEPGPVFPGDQFYYSLAGDALADGRGFVEPWHHVSVRLGLAEAGSAAPHAADHPPLTAIVAASAGLLPGEPGSHVLEQRLTMCVVGAAVVVMVGILGREAGRAIGGGRSIGVLAAATAALYPGFWINDGLVMAESLTTLMVAGALWSALRYARVPSAGGAAAMGLWVGLATLARSESLLLALLLVVPVVWGAHAEWRVRLGRLATAGTICVLAIAPWVGPNLVRFEEPVTLSTNDGITLIGANSPQTYSGDAIGFWSLEYAESIDLVARAGPDADQSEVARVYRDEAISYIGDNLRDLPRVMLARLGRVWSVYRPLQMAEWNQGEGRELWASHLAAVMFWAAVPIAFIGWWRMRLEGLARWPLVAMMVHVCLVAMLFYGLPRFRVPAEVAVVVFAAVGFRWLTGLGAEKQWSRQEAAG